MNKKVLVLIIALFITATGIRCIGLNRPLVGNFYARAIEDAMIAKNYIHNSFNIFEPSINIVVDGKPGLLLSNFHFYSYLVAIVSKLFSMDIDFAGRLTSVIFSLLCGLYLYKLTSYLIDRKTAIVALFFYLFSPLSIVYGQSFQAETLGLFMFLVSIYYFIRFMDSRSFYFFLIALISGALVFLVKIPWLPFGLLYFWIYFLRCKEKGKSLLERVDAALLIGLMVLPVIAWLLYAYAMHMSPGVYKTIFSEVSSGTVILKESYFSDPEFYKMVFDYIVTLVLNPIGFVLFLIGIFVIREKSLRAFLTGWLVLILLYCILIPKKIFEQNYYLFPLIPVMVIYAACAVNMLTEHIFNTVKLHYNKIYIIFFSLGFILASLRYSFAPSFITPDEFKYAVSAGKEISRNTDKDDLIIASSMGKSYLLYYADRYGWNLGVSEDGSNISKVEQLESLRNKNAAYFAVDYPTLNFKKSSFKQYMYRYYRPILNNEKLLLFNIRERKH